MNLQMIAERLVADLTLHTDYYASNSPDLDLIALAEETGELSGAWRRWTGRARRAGTRQEVEEELADVFFSAACFAVRAGIDIDQAIARKLEKIYSRGWKE